MFNKRRSEIEIIADILNLSKHGARKTEILYQCNLSFTQCNNYLSFLINKDILEEKKIINNVDCNDKFYKITDKGHSLLDEINKTLCYFR